VCRELQWSEDEKLCGRNSGSDIFFYENGDLDKVANKVGIPKVASFSLGLGSKPYHVVCYIPGKLHFLISEQISEIFTF
jgi:hypothetical protein